MKTKKPFNLEAALNGARVETENGSEVTDLTYFKGVTQGQPVVGVCTGEVLSWDKHGVFHHSKDPCFLDLVIVEEVEREPCYWAYRSSNGLVLYSEEKTRHSPKITHDLIPVKLVPLDD